MKQLPQLTRLICAASLALFASLALAQKTAPKPAPNSAPKPVSLPAAVTTPSGLIYQSLKEGDGEQPGVSDLVKVHYRGTLSDGKEFDSSYQRGQPAEFPLNRVIKCWTEGVGMMKLGGKAKLTCPPAIAYGERGAGGGAIPPNATLTFEVELLGIRR